MVALMDRAELLKWRGRLERGCDSVFVGPRGWSRRPASDELDDEEIRDLIQWAQPRNKDIRVAINVMPSPDEIPAFLSKVERYARWGAGGVMICDPGCIQLVRERCPELDIHVSVTREFSICATFVFTATSAQYRCHSLSLGTTELEEIRDQTQVRLEAFMFQTVKRGRICPGRCYSSSYFLISHERDEAGKDHFVGSASRGGSCHRICRRNGISGPRNAGSWATLILRRRRNCCCGKCRTMSAWASTGSRSRDASDP